MKETLGRYKIIKEVGRGAMGTVYQGYDPKIDRIVALKTIRKDRLAESRDAEDLVTRFQKEVRAAGKLVHPNIVIVYDTGEDEETAYVAMEYIEGDTLENLIQKGIRFPMDKVIDIMDQICDGLEYTHRQGIVHRDLKPSNIMLVNGERLKITDFGISKAVGAVSSPITQAGILLGTPSYMSPEQIAGKEIDGRSDLFSLGIILYQLLTGEAAFAGDTIPKLLYNIVNKDPTPPSQIDSSIPSLCDEVIAKALAKDPDKRYQTARHFIEDLRRAYRGEGLAEVPSMEPTMTVAKGVREEIRPKQKRYGLLAGLAVILLVLVLGGYYWMAFRTPKAPIEERVSGARVEERVVTPSVEKEPVRPIPPPAEKKPETVKAVGTIVLKSTPPGAWVFLDDMRHKEPTPTVIEKVPVGGRCEIRVQKRGYKPWVRTVEPESGEPLPVEATLERLAGTIVVKSTPPGASVFLDGKEVSGSTPIEFPNVSADETHKIQVKKKGYETEVQTITLKANERRELRVVLKQPLSGEIRISSIPPGAEIYLNGTYMRDTPTRLSGLSQGNYTVRLEKEGYTAWEKKVIVRASEPLDLRGVKLQEALGWLNLHVSPWADVYHKGKKVGTTPLANIPLQEGTHKLLLKNPPLNIEREITVEIVAGKVTKKGVDIMDGVKGVLKIKVHPWADVYVDGKPKGTTPLKPIELMAGEHIVLVKNEKLGKERSFPIVIKPNEVVSREVDLLNE
jgi:tRNA A-37 threonylcarbamoyl transferase component Bud32